MSQSKQDTDLMHDLASLLIVTQVLLIDRLDSNQLSRQLVHAQVDLTEGTSAKHLASSVELGRRLWGLTYFIKGMLDAIGDANHLTDTRRDLALGSIFLHATFSIVTILSNVASHSLCGQLATSQGLLSDVDRDGSMAVLGLATIFVVV